MVRRILAWILTGVIALMSTFSDKIMSVDVNGFSFVAMHALQGVLKNDVDREAIEAFREKTGGFMKGICHPKGKYEAMQGANIEWARFDLGTPMIDKDGNFLPEVAKEYRNELQGYRDNGLKVMAITPYPHAFTDRGIDPRTEEGKALVRKNAEYFMRELAGYVSAVQVTNEMGVNNFRFPLTMEEAAEFIGIQMEVMFPLRGDAVIGFNVDANAMYKLPVLMQPWLPYCDYVGIDGYPGCFENILKDLWVFDGLAEAVYDLTHKPIVFCEFGYISYGASKTAAEKKEILRSFGFESEKQARENIRQFVRNCPESLQRYISRWDDMTDEELADGIFGTFFSNHIYSELPKGYKLRKYPHTLNGQADYFTDLLRRFQRSDIVCGSFIYCMSDSDSCYICGQETCPVETGWGLLDGKGNPKPSYYAVQKAYAAF